MLMRRAMNEPRITWTTRINLRPSQKVSIHDIAERERVSIATLIGTMIDNYFLAVRSST